MTNEVLQKIASDEQNISSSNGLEPLPKLRFLEFKNTYKKTKLNEAVERIQRRDPTSEAPVMMLSAASGFIMQSEKYSRENAGQSLKKYILLRKGELAYNHGASKYKPFGCCFELKEDEARIPYVYHCFAVKENNDKSYIARLLNNQKIDQQLKRLISSSVRMDGLLNISYEEYTGIDLYLPSLLEQQKIADFLFLVDRRIEKQRQLVESLKKYKRGYFQRIISSLETSSYELKNIVDEYNAKSKIQNELPILSSTLSGIKLQNDYFNKQAASETTIGYKIVPFGYFTYRSMSDTGEFRFNLQNIIEKGIVSPAYPVFKVKEEYNAEFVEYILNETDKIKSQLLVKKEGGTRYALSFSKFQTLKIDLPTKSVQDKMVSQLRYANKILTNEEGVLSNLQKLKNGLLQQMFI